MTTRNLAGPAAVVTVLLWASAFVVIRAVGNTFAPGALGFLRLLVGTVALAVVASRYRRPLPTGRSLALVIGYGVLWFAAYTVVLNWAEQHLDPGTAALLVNVAPIIVAVVAGVAFGDGFPRPLVIGLAVAFVGVVIIAVGGDDGGVADSLGIVLGLITALLYASGVLLQKMALRSVDAVTATWVACAAGLLATTPFAPQAVGQLAHAPTGAIVGVVWLGIGPTAAAFLTWAYALSRTDAGKMAATTLSVPALAVLLSWITLGELPTLWGFIGGAFALTGVAISRLRPRRDDGNRVDDGAGTELALDEVCAGASVDGPGRPE